MNKNEGISVLHGKTLLLIKCGLSDRKLPTVLKTFGLSLPEDQQAWGGNRIGIRKQYRVTDTEKKA